MPSNDVVIDIAYVLDKLYYSAKDEHDKGDKFERLVRKFLLTEPLHADRFDEVWRWTEWPDRGKRPDHGIDLVARERDTGDLVAVQCKFYDPAHYLTKGDIDSFLAESGKHPFRSRLVVSTTDRWNSAADAAVQNQQIPVSRIGLADLAESTIDWTQFSFETPDVLATKGRKQLRPHQRTALDNVRAGFLAGDRGQLIMACGTGKTFTSLRIAEDLVPLGGHVLFLVPSIALASQALKEWSAEAEVSLRAFVVCSDSKVGRSDEDISVVDLAIPATTDAAKLAERAGDGSAEARLTVVFSTYQSIEVVAAAQRDHGLPAFDLVVCDEAHRTTGAETADQERRSAFMAVHDQTYLEATKRLYMTATPRLYDDNSKAKAGQANALLASMDDEATFGPEFHRLGFGQAVSAGLLTDYKVMVLTVDEGAISATFQRDLETNGELNLPDVARIVGCWNALAKRMTDDSFAADPEPMRRAVAFASTIKASQRFSTAFESVVATYTEAIRIAGDDDAAQPLTTHVHHVDGTMNMLAREREMDWLKGRTGANEARVLANAKCLSEGVDVPALDAVMFLHPRKSVVDVVQSVGRVMRLAPGKQYGYIILPIAVPAGMAPEEALRDNERFRVVWEVLQALRAHDERFNALINQIDLNTKRSDKISIFHVGGRGDAGDGGAPGATPATPVAVQPTFQLEALEDWREAIYARMVEKVGSRQYWETWAKSVADIVKAHTARLSTVITNPTDPEVTARFNDFVAALRANLNDSITTDAAIDMLSQHMVTRPVFDALFPGYSFTDHNPVARVMQEMLTVLEGSNLEAETERLEGFYDSVRVRAEGIDNAASKQKVIKELYEKFFRLAFPKSADALGIVYTPIEIVDFILRSVDDLLRTEFDTTISAEGVHVLDPFTGTGTFITRLLASGLIDPQDLSRKYTGELHANELLLLAYYIAAANIEATYRDLATASDAPAGDGWVGFDGIVLADTFQMTEHDDTLDGHVFAANSERAERQLDLDIRVIVGNPPYSVGQTSGNDNNANLKYTTLDAAIEDTYAARSTATNKNSLYDSYIRAIRWASDRIGDAGIIGFVTNGGFIDANTTDGLRKTLTDEFSTIYVYNLRGNQRTAGELSKKEGGKVFGSGSRNTVAITLLVKHPDHTGPATIRYHDIGDYLTREQKLALIDTAAVDTLPWQNIAPNASGDWINQRGHDFEAYQALGDKSEPGRPVFGAFSGGVKTNRDAWVYNFSAAAVRNNVGRMVDFYNSQVDDFTTFIEHNGTVDPRSAIDAFIDTDATRFSWNRADKVQAVRGRHYRQRPEALRPAAYRPFTRQAVWFDPELNDMVYRMPSMFPTPDHPNYGFYALGVGATAQFALLATDRVPDVQMIGAGQNGQFFARYTYEPVDPGREQGAFDLTGGESDVIDGYRRLDNITDHTLATYRRWYGPQVTADHVFAVVYGLLHSPDYRSRFAADLKRTLPHIPRIETADFTAFRDAGQGLLDLHIRYEQVDPYPLTFTGEQPQAPGSADLHGWFAVEKMRWGGTAKAKDRSTIIFNPHITVSGIPDAAHEYMLGSRSALEWILDRYQVRIDKPSGIRNDPNDYSREVGNPRYILDLIAKVTTVSVRTVEIVNALPPLRIAEDQS